MVFAVWPGNALAELEIVTQTYDELGRLEESEMQMSSDLVGEYRSKTVYVYDAYSNIIETWVYARTDTEDGVFSDAPQVSRTYFDDPSFPSLPTMSVDADGYAVVTEYNPYGLVEQRVGPFFDSVAGPDAGDPGCQTVDIACIQYDYQPVAGVQMLSEQRSKREQGSCEKAIYAYYGSSKYYALQSITLSSDCSLQ
ncbi:MAG: hypothetical protein MRY72_08775 [Aquisalinus sp.]|nr:hypothetical protein [Aquisalinus sp.]